MKIVVIGGSGLIGSKLVAHLGARATRRCRPPRPRASTPSPARGSPRRWPAPTVVVDVSNSPSFEDAAVLEFFQTSTRNLLAAEAAAGVGHHVALSSSGADRLPDSGYMRAKVAQEAADRGVGGAVHDRARHAVLRVPRRASPTAGTDGDTVRLPPALMQPMAADDVAAALAEVAVAATAANGTVEIAGPEPIRIDEFVRRCWPPTATPAGVGRPARPLLRHRARRSARSRPAPAPGWGRRTSTPGSPPRPRSWPRPGRCARRA